MTAISEIYLRRITPASMRKYQTQVSRKEHGQILERVKYDEKRTRKYSMRGIQNVRAILEYFRCMIGNTAEAWSYCSSRSDSDMLRVWFICSPFVSSECGVKMVATQEVCTKDEQH
jgi:hypothetical protein